MKSVAILLATYKPNIAFLKQQLISINEQDYADCHLYVCDDSADNDYFAQVKHLVFEHIHTMRVTFVRNEQNLGSNLTFEKLTQVADADYFAYCDQDDVWFPTKISQLVAKIEQEQAVACYSDLSVIDENGKKVCDSFTQYNPRVRHLFGDNLFGTFIRRNSITGCTLLISSKVAKEALPFYSAYIHDHWLALFAASKGRIAYVATPLIAYRIHGHNQIGKAVLQQITTVDDYVPEKLLPEKEKFANLKDRINLTAEMVQAVEGQLAFVNARIAAFQTRRLKAIWQLWQYRWEDKQLVYLEVILASLPKFLGNYLLKKIKK